ncbi:hypothetical protein ACOZDE_18615 [Streptomyces griseoincarnatus]
MGNPLAGVLGHLDQRARIGGRTRTSTGRREEPTAPPAVVTAPVMAPGGPVGAVVATDQDGRAVWAFPAPYGTPPAVTATAVDPDSGDDERTVWAVLEEATTRRATVRVWRSRGRRGSGVAEPVGADVLVHLIAVSSPG